MKITKNPDQVTLDSYMKDAKAVGGIYRMQYDNALVLTDDHAKHAAGGVPRGAFLLGAAGRQTPEGFALDDEEIMLLKVIGTSPLPNENELVQTRMSVVRDAHANNKNYSEESDVLTRAEMQQSAFECEILGTLYVDDDSSRVRFGADIDNVVSTARYQVFAPSKAALSLIASYSENDSAVEDRVEIGVVRYSSTRRRSQESGMADALVTVDVEDLIAKKTAVFGMTRTGKSNTIKTLCTSVFKHSRLHKTPIGQVIFDPQGEYANENQQDGTGLCSLGDANFVRIYGLGATGDNPQVFPLEMNFYDPENFEVVTEFLKNTLTSSRHGDHAYAKSFAALNWEEPDQADYSEYTQWSRGRLAMYALLHACRFDGHKTPFPSVQTSRASKNRPAGLPFKWQQEQYEEFAADNPNAGITPPKNGNTYFAATPSDAHAVVVFMQKRYEVGEEGGWRGSKGEFTPAHDVMTVIFDRISAQALIKELTDFHNVDAVDRVEDLIWDDVCEGRISIIDLSRGGDRTAKMISEKIVVSLLSRANDRFRADDANVRMQLVVEEAHNLFERGAKDVANNPWVRLSKEASKYSMGLVYATQEISSVDKRILSNTSNWFVAHLNSHDEIRELSRFYDFASWEDSLLRCDDRGFVRMKTHSNKFSVPIQVAKFELSMIEDARKASGQMPLPEALAELDDEPLDEDPVATPAEEDPYDDEVDIADEVPEAFSEPDAAPVAPKEPDAPYERRARRSRIS